MDKLLVLVLATSLALSARTVCAGYVYEDYSVSTKDLGNSCMTTIDFKITEELAKQNSYSVKYEYGEIRQDGVLLDIYYSNTGFVKAQWSPVGSKFGVYLMPGAIHLPIAEWIKSGMKPSWWIRLVILDTKKCVTSPRNYEFESSSE